MNDPVTPTNVDASLIHRLAGGANCLRLFLNRYAWPVVDLLIRFWIARVFFLSGLTKIRNWDSTVFLFEAEYRVPVLPPEAAAIIGTTFELTMPVLILLGLFTRIAALPLLGMALVIQFVLGAGNPAYDHVEHFYWMILLLVLITRGAGPVSLDRLLLKRLCGVFGKG